MTVPTITLTTSPSSSSSDGTTPQPQPQQQHSQQVDFDGRINHIHHHLPAHQLHRLDSSLSNSGDVASGIVEHSLLLLENGSSSLVDDHHHRLLGVMSNDISNRGVSDADSQPMASMTNAANAAGSSSFNVSILPPRRHEDITIILPDHPLSPISSEMFASEEDISDPNCIRRKQLPQSPTRAIGAGGDVDDDFDPYFSHYDFRTPDGEEQQQTTIPLEGNLAPPTEKKDAISLNIVVEPSPSSSLHQQQQQNQQKYPQDRQGQPFPQQPPQRGAPQNETSMLDISHFFENLDNIRTIADVRARCDLEKDGRHDPVRIIFINNCGARMFKSVSELSHFILRNINPKTSKENFLPFWVDVQNPTKQDVARIGKLFHLHPLTSEDIIHSDTGEKFETFEDYVFIVLHDILENNPDSSDDEFPDAHPDSGHDRIRSPNSVPHERSHRSQSMNARKTTLKKRLATIKRKLFPQKRTVDHSRSHFGTPNDLATMSINILLFEHVVVTIHKRPLRFFDTIMQRIEGTVICYRVKPFSSAHPAQNQNKDHDSSSDDEEEMGARTQFRHILSQSTNNLDLLHDSDAETTPNVHASQQHVHTAIPSDLLSSEQAKADGRKTIFRRKLIPSPDWILYTLLDTMADMYVPIVESLADNVEALDEFVLLFSQDEQDDLLRRIGMVRSQIVYLRRLIWPKKNLLTYLISRKLPFISEIIHIYLRDILDHISECGNKLDLNKELLNQTHSNYMARLNMEVSVSANRTNNIMKRLAIVATIFAPMAFIGSIWGMNVEVPGENGGPVWFYVILLAMVISVFSIVLCCRKRLTQ